jgi:hypothetical protein
MKKIFHFDAPRERYQCDAAVIWCFDNRFDIGFRKFLKSVAPAWAGPSGKELAVPRGCVLHTERVQAAEVGRIVSGVSKPD